MSGRMASPSAGCLQADPARQGFVDEALVKKRTWRSLEGIATKAPAFLQMYDRDGGVRRLLLRS